jgi:hypothetical protein
LYTPNFKDLNSKLLGNNEIGEEERNSNLNKDLNREIEIRKMETYKEYDL